MNISLGPTGALDTTAAGESVSPGAIANLNGSIGRWSQVVLGRELRENMKDEYTERELVGVSIPEKGGRAI